MGTAELNRARVFFFCLRGFGEAAYPPPGGYAATAPPLPAGQPYVQPPPIQAAYVQPASPAGYPGSFTGAMMNPPPPQEVAPAQTQSRGDKAFWEGW